MWCSSASSIRAVAGAALIGIVGVCGLLVPRAAFAQVLELRPVELDFTQDHKAQAFSLVNRAAQAATVQVRAFRWTQGVDGKDVLTPTQDLMLSPPFVQLGAGETQVVRVRFVGAVQPQEAAYRLLVDQLPIRAESGIRTALRLSMPAFVSPLFVKPPKVSWLWSRDEGGGSYVTLTNNGGEHALVGDVKIRSPSGDSLLLPPDGSAYILSGVTRRWRLGGPFFPERRSALQVAASPSAPAP